AWQTLSYVRPSQPQTGLWVLGQSATGRGAQVPGSPAMPHLFSSWNAQYSSGAQLALGGGAQGRGGGASTAEPAYDVATARAAATRAGPAPPRARARRETRGGAMASSNACIEACRRSGSAARPRSTARRSQPGTFVAGGGAASSGRRPYSASYS